MDVKGVKTKSSDLINSEETTTRLLQVSFF